MILNLTGSLTEQIVLACGHVTADVITLAAAGNVFQVIDIRVCLWVYAALCRLLPVTHEAQGISSVFIVQCTITPLRMNHKASVQSSLYSVPSHLYE